MSSVSFIQEHAPGLFTFHGSYIFKEWRASLVAEIVKNLPAMWETGVRSLGWEALLKEGMATHSSMLAWRIPWTDHGVTKSWIRLSDL